MSQDPQELTDFMKNHDKNNNTDSNEPFVNQVKHEEVIQDPGLESVKNFERLMKLFPSEHPSGIHGIMVICNNNIEKALDMLLYVSECRKHNVDKACSNCTVAESDVEILEESLKTIDKDDDDDDGGDDEDDEDYTPTTRKMRQRKQEENRLKKTPKRIMKLKPFDAPKKKKGPSYTVPTKAALKAVYTDPKSQFVKIEELES